MGKRLQISITLTTHELQMDIKVRVFMCLYTIHKSNNNFYKKHT